jgi:hypothetical protein
MKRILVTAVVAAAVVLAASGALFAQDRSDVYCEKGADALDAKDYVKAEQYFLKAAEINERNDDAWYGLCVVYIINEDVESFKVAYTGLCYLNIDRAKEIKETLEQYANEEE